MASYRRMRRQARQIRRSGMQPMMVINADPGQFPIPAGVLLARFAWRYRSELAPLTMAATTLGRGVVGTRQLAAGVGAHPSRLLGQRVAYRDLRRKARTRDRSLNAPMRPP